MIALKPSEVRFWQEVFLAHVESYGSGPAAERADTAVQLMRERIEDPGPRPDAGRL